MDKIGTITIGQCIKNNAVDENFNPRPNIDDKYGPYNSISEALEAIPLKERSLGLTFGIKDSTSINEYWFKDSLTNPSQKQPIIAKPQKLKFICQGDDFKLTADIHASNIVVEEIEPKPEPYGYGYGYDDNINPIIGSFDNIE